MPKQVTTIRKPDFGVPAAKSRQTLRTARSGETYVYESDEWRVGRYHILPWSKLTRPSRTEQFAPELVDSFRRMMAELVEEVSDGTARGVFDQICSLLAHCSDSINIESFECWRASLSKRNLAETSRRGYLLHCRIGLNAWADGNYPGLEPRLVDHFRRIKVGQKDSGRAVSEMCPVRGPFTHMEEAGLISWLHQAYADDVLSLQCYAMLLVLVEFGCRPVELAALRAGDVIDAQAEHPYQLAIPTAKGRRAYRGSFRRLELPEDLYALLKQVIVEGQEQVALAWGQSIPPRISKQLPLFVGKRLFDAGSGEMFERKNFKTPQTFDIHVWSHIDRPLRNCSVRTERLDGDLMPLSLYRFRRTVATRLAEAGASDEIIASVLGHTTLQSARLYTAHTYEDQQAVDEIMVEAWQPVMAKVAEQLLDIPISGQARIHVSREEQVGNCSQLCGGGILTCYICPKFRPFVDAAHSKALDNAESLRQDRIDHGMSGPEVDSLDQSIAAIRATILACEDKKATRQSNDG